MENDEVTQNQENKVPKSYETGEKEVLVLNEIDLSGTYSYAHYLCWKFAGVQIVYCFR